MDSRSIERNRPYLINQYETLIHQQADGHFDNVNDVSSDSEAFHSDEEKKQEVSVFSGCIPFHNTSDAGIPRRSL